LKEERHTEDQEQRYSKNNNVTADDGRRTRKVQVKATGTRQRQVENMSKDLPEG